MVKNYVVSTTVCRRPSHGQGTYHRAAGATLLCAVVLPCVVSLVLVLLSTRRPPRTGVSFVSFGLLSFLMGTYPASAGDSRKERLLLTLLVTAHSREKELPVGRTSSLRLCRAEKKGVFPGLGLLLVSDLKTQPKILFTDLSLTFRANCTLFSKAQVINLQVF
jgi:hypothetical protein